MILGSFSLQVEFQPKSDKHEKDSYFCTITYKGKKWNYKVPVDDIRRHFLNSLFSDIFNRAQQILTNVITLEPYESDETIQ